jgi:hypothetical protein
MKAMRLLTVAAAGLLAASLAGCNDNNGSGGGGGSGGGSSVTLSGTVIQGPLSGATVTAFPVNADGTAGTPALGSTTTGSDGSFTLSFSGAKPPLDVMLVTSGGSYASEANITTTVTNADGSGLSALLPQVGATGLSGIVVSPLTTLSVSRAQGVIAGAAPAAKSLNPAAPRLHDACSGTPVACGVSAADELIKGAFGIGSGSPLSSLKPDFSATSGDAAVLAASLGALEQEALSQSVPPASLVGALALDYFDGSPDGNGAGGGPVTFPGTTRHAPSALGSSILLSSLSTYLSNSSNPPAGITTASNGVAFDTSVPRAIRTGIGSVAPPSAALTTSSSGAVSEIVVPSTGHQLVLVAARRFGLQGVDIADPTSPVLNGFPKLNAALVALKDASGNPSLPSVDAVTAVPGQTDAEAVLSSFRNAHVVLVDLDQQTVLRDSDFSATLKTRTSFSGGSAFISSSLYDGSVGALGGVHLATGDGYFTYDISDGTLSTPIPLSANHIPAENLGGATTDTTLFADGGLLLSGNYGPNGSGGGLQLVDLGKGIAYALDDEQYQSGFGVTRDFGGGPSTTQFNIVDSNSVDTNLHVGVITPEDSDYIGFIDLHDPAQFSFTGTGDTASFSAATLGVMKTVVVSDSSGFPVLSGSAVESSSHLLLGMAAFSQTLLVGHLDDPVTPANGTAWAGLTDWRFYNANSSEYNSTEADPHAVGALLASQNNRSYGVVLSIDGAAEHVLLIDLQAFLDAAAQGPDVHQLAATPFGTPIIQAISLSNTFVPATSTAAPHPSKVQRKSGALIRN